MVLQELALKLYRENLNFVESERLLQEYSELSIDNGVTSELLQFVAIYGILERKGVTPTELAGFYSGARKFCLRHPFSDLGDMYKVGMCGTGGGKLRTINVSTLAALLCPSIGVTILKHGARAVTGVVGSTDFIEHIGYDIRKSPDVLLGDLEKHRFAYAEFATWLKNVEIAGMTYLPGLFHQLGPILCPFKINSLYCGVNSEYEANLIRETFEVLHAEKIVPQDYKLYMICGLDNSGQILTDEVSPFGETRIWEVTSTGTELHRIHPEDFGVTSVAVDEAPTYRDRNDILSENMRIIRGEGHPVNKIFVALTAAVVLHFENRAEDPTVCFERSYEAIINGSLHKTIEALHAESTL